VPFAQGGKSIFRFHPTFHPTFHSSNLLVMQDLRPGWKVGDSKPGNHCWRHSHGVEHRFISSRARVELVLNPPLSPFAQLIWYQELARWKVGWNGGWN